MRAQPVLTFRGFDPSPLARALIAQRIASLERIGAHILHCAVVVEVFRHWTPTARGVRVHVIVSLPGPDLAVSRESVRGVLSQDLRLAVAQAFDALEAALGHYTSLRHAMPPQSPLPSGPEPAGKGDSEGE